MTPDPDCEHPDTTAVYRRPPSQDTWLRLGSLCESCASFLPSDDIHDKLWPRVHGSPGELVGHRYRHRSTGVTAVAVAYRDWYLTLRADGETRRVHVDTFRWQWTEVEGDDDE